MISSARLGDKHVCPMPGHGITPIASASADAHINFMGAARVGDTCGCGAVITTGFPSILINYRPLAHMGSPTSHGGTIITGSGDTFGGFVMGVAPGAVIINFAALGAFRPDGSVDDEKMATLLADPNLKEKAVAANALVDPGDSPKTQDTGAAEPVVCNHPDQMEQLATYIADEMNRNIHDPAVLKMRNLIGYDPEVAAKRFTALPLFARIGGRPNFGDIAKARKAAAAAIWTKKVGQNQEWDHKPKLKALFNGTFWHKQGKYMYFYDIWSNIHYGYVGIIGGLSESVLLDGAGAEQIVSDTLRKGEEWVKKPQKDWRLPGPHPTASPWTELRSWDDVADRVAISIGVKLANQHPNGGITAKMVMDEVLAVPPENWGEGIDDHKCE
ncbi:polymorphic toxin type 44 domain-containing protein [Pseudomonas chlororaphis]|uniref:polymorphic toxin type 44 domain-containing protein n=1 Tax=Pseudomonas chlororaphis TaxID=587753 RepID=UPI0015DDFA85|nr:polymorphic toxin type 44 domain-containing protein [Pseudomonas chlororaphis]QLL15704.1 PAAR domain-containing protein [Pseudomonas chlororaphis subsp. aurantiaca]